MTIRASSAPGNTIGFSTRGANVVANGGHVVLERNEIVGSKGDGVASWNDCYLRVRHNSIHSNVGFGVLMNTDAGFSTVEHNALWENGEGGALCRGLSDRRQRSGE